MQTCMRGASSSGYPAGMPWTGETGRAKA
eukprot:SAG11_NODE_31263_length_293_cov_0.860825_1_plen_28_part_10